MSHIWQVVVVPRSQRSIWAHGFSQRVPGSPEGPAARKVAAPPGSAAWGVRTGRWQLGVQRPEHQGWRDPHEERVEH